MNFFFLRKYIPELQVWRKRGGGEVVSIREHACSSEICNERERFAHFGGLKLVISQLGITITER